MYVHLPMFRERKQEEIGFFCGFVFGMCCFFFLRGLFLLMIFQVPGKQQQLVIDDRKFHGNDVY